MLLLTNNSTFYKVDIDECSSAIFAVHRDDHQMLNLLNEMGTQIIEEKAMHLIAQGAPVQFMAGSVVPVKEAADV